MRAAAVTGHCRARTATGKRGQGHAEQNQGQHGSNDFGERVHGLQTLW
jgi:hypothetical protein